MLFMHGQSTWEIVFLSLIFSIFRSRVQTDKENGNDAGIFITSDPRTRKN